MVESTQPRRGREFKWRQSDCAMRPERPGPAELKGAASQRTIGGHRGDPTNMPPVAEPASFCTERVLASEGRRVSTCCGNRTGSQAAGETLQAYISGFCGEERN